MKKTLPSQCSPCVFSIARWRNVPGQYKNAVVITLQPLETLVFEALPVN